MKKLITCLSILFATIAFSVQVQAQTTQSESSSSKKTTTTEIIETTDKQSYIGLSGGYLFKNKSIHDNPMWYLNDGQFGELNLGMRNGLFGWSTAIGYLMLDRDRNQFENIFVNTKLMFNNADLDDREYMQPENITSGLEDNLLYFGPETHDFSVSKPFRGFYLITGPNIWIGEGKLQFNAALEGGIGYSQTGYYAVGGHAESALGELELESIIDGANPSAYEASIYNTTYVQYGMSEKYFDKVSSSAEANPFNEKEPYEVHWLARLSINAEYFLTPRISLHGGANLWYIATPKMKGAQNVSGFASYSNDFSYYTHAFEYEEEYEKKDLMHLSANVGLKYWFGGTKHTKKVEVLEEENQSKLEELAETEEKTVENKKVIVTVIDELTKTPMGEVDIVLIGENGEEYKAQTKENGTVTINDVAASAYQVNGSIYGVDTKSDSIDKNAFEEDTSTIYATLHYNDPRFILKGVAVNTDTGNPEKDVKVTLDKDNQSISKTDTNSEGNFQFLLESNSDYKVQGLKSGLYSNTESASTKGLNRSKTLYVKLQLGVNTVELGKSFVLDNILYDFDDDAIRPDAAIELNRLAAFLEENPDVRIELSSHTDSRGNNNYNMALSQRRAQSAVNYLISVGIERNRMIAQGYGETRLLNNCADGVDCSEEQHQENRRTEVKIIE